MENSKQSNPGQQSHLPQQIPQAEIHAYKSKLQQYAQRAGLELPMYNATVKGEPHALVFKCSVTVDDETYESPNSFSQKKAAEQDAAKNALECIMEKRQEIGSSIISKNTTLCKAILNEFAAKLQIGKPTYTTVQTQQLPLPVFVSKIEFRGVWFSGRPARTKKEAEHLAAHDATLSILGHSEEDSTLLEIIRSKADLFSGTQVALDPSCFTIPCEEEQFKDATKSPPRPLQTENIIDPPVQTPPTEHCKVVSPSPSPSPSPAIAVLMYVPSSFQNLTNPTTMQVLGNQSCGVASSEHQLLFAGPPQSLVTAYQDDANRGCEASCASPQEVLAAAALNQDSSALCGLQTTQRLSRNQRRKANKRARIANC